MSTFIGPNGAKFHVQESSVFTKEDIARKVESGEWTPVDDKPAAAKKAPASKPKK